MFRILCGEDDRYVQKLLQDMLEDRGYEVCMCKDGLEVLTALAADGADLLILDMIMPQMSGTQVIQKLRKNEQTSRLPVIVISGVGDEETIVETLSEGADDYIVKPFTADELIAKVTMALRRRQAQEAPKMELAVGKRFANRYDIVREVQSGGFSTVFLAHDTGQKDSPEIALKVFDLPPSRRADRQFISLFLREAYEMSKLDHPNIVKFHDFGQSGTYYYLTMEYLHGQSINTLVAETGPLPEGDAVYVGYEVAKAIQYMASQNVVHRDIKPPNIMVTVDGDVRLLDFGLAKQQADKTLSMQSEFKGTPSFVSPEYIDGDQPVDVLSDVYSLGATLYYAASSIILFAGKTPREIMNSHLKLVPPSLREFDPNISEEFSDFIDRMLAKKKPDRPPVDEIVETFREMLASRHETTSKKQSEAG